MRRFTPLFYDGTDASTTATGVAVLVKATIVEIKTVRTTRVEIRGRPVAAEAANAVRNVVPAVARSWQENRSAVRSGDFTSVHAVKRSKFAGAVVAE